MPKFATLDEFYASLPQDQEQGIHRLVEAVADAHPECELVIAWNQPMFKLGKHYLIGFMPTKKHINLLTVTDSAITHLADRLAEFKHGTRSVSLPFDWLIDMSLINDVISFRKKELGL